MTQAGIDYVCQNWATIQNNREGQFYFDRLREIIVQKAVELAFRRHLAEMEVPHQWVEPSIYSQPDYHGIALGGRRCVIIGGLVSSKEDISRMRTTPRMILNELALAPIEENRESHVGREDVVVFALVGGLVARGWDDVKAAQAAGEPTYFIYPMPKRWAQPSGWKELGRISLKSESEDRLVVEIGGQDKSRRFLAEQVNLPPRTRLLIEKKFYSISYLHVGDSVGGRVGIHSKMLDETILIRPQQWGNIWVYGMQILLLGYMQRGEFLNNAEAIQMGTHVFQARHGTQQEYMGMPINELHAMKDLFQRTRKWANQA